VESAGDAQEKQARSYELEFRWKLQICKLQISSSLDLIYIDISALSDIQKKNLKKNFSIRKSFKIKLY
jgi:hypothetical protein